MEASVTCRELFNTCLQSLNPDTLLADCLVMDSSTTSPSLLVPSKGRVEISRSEIDINTL